jgi:3-methylcrotonyl-CoA carboxylase alpha subunit
MEHRFDLGSRAFLVAPRYDGGALDLEIDGRRAFAELFPVGPSEYELRCDGHRERVFAVWDGDQVHVHLRGRAVAVDFVDPLDRVHRESRARHGAGELRAPMPGVVIEHRVATGDRVEAGDTLLVIESMKLQTAIAAETAGCVTALPLSVGQTFARGHVLARVEAAAPEATP